MSSCRRGIVIFFLISLHGKSSSSSSFLCTYRWRGSTSPSPVTRFATDQAGNMHSHLSPHGHTGRINDSPLGGANHYFPIPVSFPLDARSLLYAGLIFQSLGAERTLSSCVQYPFYPQSYPPVTCSTLMPFEEGGNGGNLLAAALQNSVAPCVSAAKRRPAVWERKGSCKFFMWCDEFFALGRSSSAKCECDEVMQKLVEENEILRKRVQELQLQLEKKTRITASLGRVISTLTTEEADN
ncbi:hypothetical protein Taro_041557 [Colocasia esculenta]|uniref:Uncharacterized protein n=1 Tax=Colocasia esculenta TaxID=4460 RepID=A0A843WG60_COLES|nr:hypothetical protein [Colocasia esculenta]